MAKNAILTEGAFDYTVRKRLNDNLRDVSLCTTQFDAVTGTTGATLTNVVGLVSDTLEAGTYSFRVSLPGVATANCGLKVGLKFGTASMLTSLQSTSRGFTASAVAVQQVTSTTDQASLFASTTAVIFCDIVGVLVVGTAGTLQVQAAQNAAHADTTSVYVRASFELTRIG